MGFVPWTCANLLKIKCLGLACFVQPFSGSCPQKDVGCLADEATDAGVCVQIESTAALWTA